MLPIQPQQIKINNKLQNTYGYVDVNNDIFKIDDIEIVIGDNLKQIDVKNSKETILKPIELAEIIYYDIILSYKNCLIVQNEHIYHIKSKHSEYMNNYKILPIAKVATIENVAEIFYDKLYPIISKKGCKLICVAVTCGNTKGKCEKGKCEK